MLPLERFNAVWRPDEPERLQPVFVERVTIREALRGPTLASLLGSVQLVEPTFQVRSRLGPCALLIEPTSQVSSKHSESQHAHP